MNKHYKTVLGLGALLGLTTTHASLSSSYQFNGNGNWSIDAIGGNSSPVGIVSAVVPVGSTVEQAFLYSSIYSGGAAAVPDISLAGTAYSGAAWTDLGANLGAPNLRAFRTDVTAQMQTAIGGGSAAQFDFNVDEIANNSGTDGEVLVVVYSNPAESERTIAVLDGSSDSNGDSTSINFATPLTDVGNAGFEALVSLGIGWSFQPAGQYSIVDGNSRTLTSSAGGQDDGGGFNGGLITAGGLGDSSDNPDPTVLDAGGPRTDDELYDLAKGNLVDPTPFLANGMTSYTFDTLNPSDNDNIFFLGVNITARAGVNEPPPPSGVPDGGSTLGLLALGLAGLVGGCRRSRK